jgi:hypothetical protein
MFWEVELTALSLEIVVAILGQLAGTMVWFGRAPVSCVVADSGKRFDVVRDSAGRIVKIEPTRRTAWAYF